MASSSVKCSTGVPAGDPYGVLSSNIGVDTGDACGLASTITGSTSGSVSGTNDSGGVASKSSTLAAGVVFGSG